MQSFKETKEVRENRSEFIKAMHGLLAKCDWSYDKLREEFPKYSEYFIVETRRRMTTTNVLLPSDSKIPAVLEQLRQDERQEAIRTELQSVMSSPQPSDVLTNGHGVTIDDTRERAASKLEAYVKRDDAEKLLAEHQESTLDSIRSFFQGGGTSGYVSLPTGAGKTRIITELSQALDDFNIVVLSPTRQILEQTYSTAQELYPAVEMSNYYSHGKDTSGRVINTTYHSFVKLFESGEIDPKKIGLVICDEAHNALGEERHKAFRLVPNALKIGLTATPYFAQLEGYKQRGIVDEGEPWTGLFTESIHEMSLPEAMQKGVLTQLNAYIVETGVRNQGISITGGEYNARDLDKALNTEVRNCMAIGMLSGADKVPPGVKLSEEQRKNIDEIHEIISGKRTVVFGLSIDHVDGLASRLRAVGVTAEAVHSGTSPTERRRIMREHAEGKIQVLLGIDLLREGWDSPPTEVAIMMQPTMSGIVAVQRLGRILRPSAETGKSEAIVVDMADKFSFWQAPILVTDIFDPHYVLRGTATGTAPSHSQNEASQKAVVTFHGDIEFAMRSAHSRDLLRQSMTTVSVEKIDKAIKGMVKEILENEPNLSTFEFYKAVADSFPRHIPRHIQSAILNHVASIDSNRARTGRNALVYLNMKSILSALEQFGREGKNEMEDMLHAAIQSVIEESSKFRSGAQVSQSVYMAAERGAFGYLAEREMIPVSWVQKGAYSYIMKEIDALAKSLGVAAISQNDAWGLASEIAERVSDKFKIGDKNARYLERWEHYKGAGRTKLSVFDSLRLYTEAKIESRIGVRAGADTMDAITERRDFTRRVNLAMTNILPEREARILRLRHGLEVFDKGTPTYGAIKSEFDLTIERVRQLEGQALSRLSQLRELSGIGDIPYLGGLRDPKWQSPIRTVEHYDHWRKEPFGSLPPWLEPKTPTYSDRALNLYWIAYKHILDNGGSPYELALFTYFASRLGKEDGRRKARSLHDDLYLGNGYPYDRTLGMITRTNPQGTDLYYKPSAYPTYGKVDYGTFVIPENMLMALALSPFRNSEFLEINYEFFRMMRSRDPSSWVYPWSFETKLEFLDKARTRLQAPAGIRERKRISGNAFGTNMRSTLVMGIAAGIVGDQSQLDYTLHEALTYHRLMSGEGGAELTHYNEIARKPLNAELTGLVGAFLADRGQTDAALELDELLKQETRRDSRGLYGSGVIVDNIWLPDRGYQKSVEVASLAATISVGIFMTALRQSVRR